MTLPKSSDVRTGSSFASASCGVLGSTSGTGCGIFGCVHRASSGVYEDKGIPALKDWLGRAVQNPIEWHERLIPDEQAGISVALTELVDQTHCHLVLTTGGTGPAPRDVTPEATVAIAHKVLPGFGEQMRQVSLKYVPTAILSRQCAVIRGKCLVINLPGQPKSIQETLEGLRDAEGKSVVAGIFAAYEKEKRRRGLADFEGHAAGVEAIRGLLQHAVRSAVVVVVPPKIAARSHEV